MWKSAIRISQNFSGRFNVPYLEHDTWYTPYTKDEKIKAIKEAATLGLPVKLQYASLIGLSPMDTYALTYLENNILNLSDNWMPLVSGYTQGAATSDGGAPQKDITELSPEGLETRDKDKNDN